MGASSKFLVTIVDSSGHESTSKHFTDNDLDAQFLRVLDDLGVQDVDGKLVGDTDITSVTIRRLDNE
jgi:hypothetical protein